MGISEWSGPRDMTQRHSITLSTHCQRRRSGGVTVYTTVEHDVSIDEFERQDERKQKGKRALMLIMLSVQAKVRASSPQCRKTTAATASDATPARSYALENVSTVGPP